MKLLDLKYILVKNEDGIVEGFCSIMPTMEDEFAVVYIYEIHLVEGLFGFVLISFFTPFRLHPLISILEVNQCLSKYY